MGKHITLNHFKDEILDGLSRSANIAQFVSYSDKLHQRFSHVYGFQPNHTFTNVEDAITQLLDASTYHSINIRTFFPEQPQSCEFIFGITDIQVALAYVNILASRGLFLIIHETIPFDDGGISGGVLQCGVIELSAGEGPRFVETSQHAVTTFEKDFALRLMTTIYGFEPELNYPDNKRIEFSIHPMKVGCRKTHTIIWEMQTVETYPIKQNINWPTSLSVFIGDKAFGLLVAHLLGFKVPHTTVYPRDKRLEPFDFGTNTKCGGIWTRTCPKVQEPGRFTTIRGYKDPQLLMESDDPTGEFLVSCLHQQEVLAQYSGAAMSTDDGLVIDGVLGFGDVFMVGTAAPAELPDYINEAVICLNNKLTSALGPVRFEWVHDGTSLWIVQLHTGMSVSSGRVIVPGDFKNTIYFDIADGLEHLRELLKTLPFDTGIIVSKNIGMTSHVCDVLRKAGVPSRLES